MPVRGQVGLNHRLQIDAPYAELGKADVIRPGKALGGFLRVDAFLYESGCGTGGRLAWRCAALRHLQQVPRASRWVRRNQHRDPTQYADLTFVGGS